MQCKNCKSEITYEQGIGHFCDCQCETQDNFDRFLWIEEELKREKDMEIKKKELKTLAKKVLKINAEKNKKLEKLEKEIGGQILYIDSETVEIQIGNAVYQYENGKLKKLNYSH